MKNPSDTIVEWITEDAELRSCEAIPESQCRQESGNFLKNVLSGFCSKLAEQLVSPGTTLPWLLSVFGAGSGVAGFLVPIKNFGSLLPQLMISGTVRKYKRRKYFWAVPAFVQALMVAGMGWCFLFLEGMALSVGIIFGLLLFSLASGVSSLAFKDVLAKTIDKGRRGRLLASRATGGGLLTLLFGLALYVFLSEAENTTLVYFLFGGAALLWVGAGAFFLWIREHEGATDGGRNALEEVRQGFSLLREDLNFRRFIVSRCFLMGIPLAQPFFVLIGKQYTDSSFAGLGLFVIASGLAALVSSPFWGRFSDQSSRKLMIGMAVFGILNCALVFGFTFLPESWRTAALFSPLLLLNMMAHGGARLSRKTYITDYAPEEERPLYVALGNTLIGLFTVLTGGIGILGEWLGYPFLLTFLAAMLAASLWFSWKLKEV